MPDGLDLLIEVTEEHADAVEQDLARRRLLRQARRRGRALRLRQLKEIAAGGLGIVLRDVAGLLGAAGIAYGAWLVYRPAGFIVGGLLLLAGAWVSAAKGE